MKKRLVYNGLDVVMEWEPNFAMAFLLYILNRYYCYIINDANALRERSAQLHILPFFFCTWGLVFPKENDE